MKAHKGLILLILCTIWYKGWAFQSCEIPIVIDLGETSSASIQIEWIDFNTNSESFEFEVILSTESQTGTPNIIGIIGDSHLIDNLEAGNSYELFIRAQCPNGTSDWNGPYQFNTSLTADANCDFQFQISDDQCPIPDVFLFENEISGLLGENLFIESVDIAVEHNWPPDLKLVLVSPNGQKIDLLSHLGINSQNLGDPLSPCEQSLTFSDRACEFVRDASFPIMGHYQPEMSIATLYDGSEGAGNWALEVCDRAEGDIGILKQFNINFSQGTCYPPGEIFISKIAGSFVEITWNSPSCDELEIIYGIEPFDPATASVSYVSCPDQFIKIENLEEDADYIFFINTICSLETFENECPVYLHTECANPSLDLNFDNFEICEESCNAPCDLDNDFWNNVHDDDLDWLINTDRTPTAFTGPEGDLKGTGNYIYVDAASSTCGDFLFTAIESACINIQSNSNACDLSFYYYMYGVDIGTLGIDISLNNGQEWINLWSATGDQGEAWQQAAIDLSAYDNQVGIFRIFAETKDGNFGDIAVDEIKLYASLIAEPLDIFYEDLDGDGFGNPDKPYQFCALTTPTGFADNNDDCNDDNPLINPSINESPCNLIDDNCDLQIDEPNSNNMSYEGAEVIKASCSGNKDASIEISIEGGIPPYTYQWNDGRTENPNINVNPGIFQCTITDQGGCVLISDFIIVGAEKELVFDVLEIENNECEGSITGAIHINIEGGTAPYQFGWSNGFTQQNPINLGAGEYVVTITDENNCAFISTPIEIINELELNTEVIINKSTSCLGVEDGELFVSTTGGTAPYNYTWSHGASGNQVQNLASNYYSYTVTDNHGCIQTKDSILVTTPEELHIRIDAIEANLCNSENEGIILTTPIGGTPPYNYFWSNGEISDDIKSLENGTYHLTVNDSNGCSATLQDIIILSPPEIEATITEINNETCRSGQDGFISIVGSGGSGNYNYNWSNGVTNENSISNLVSGIYSVTVIDDFGCKKTVSNIEIFEENNDLPVFINLLESIDCFGENDAVLSASASQGTFPYDFNWSNGNQNIGNFSNDTILNNSAGLYNLTVTDGLGCTGISEFIEVIEPEMLIFNANVTNAICEGVQLGSIDLDIDGGIGPYHIEWNNGMNGASLDNLPAGIYQATIIDGNNCMIQTNEINILNEITINPNIDITNATSSTLGMIEINPNGGNGPYTAILDNVILGTGENFIIDSLSIGNHTLLIVDAQGCELSLMFSIEMIDTIEEIDEDKNFVIYPNPSNDIINIKGPQIVDASMKLISIHGESILQSDKIDQAIDISKISPGIYFIQIKIKDKIFTRKIVVH